MNNNIGYIVVALLMLCLLMSVSIGMVIKQEGKIHAKSKQIIIKKDSVIHLYDSLLQESTRINIGWNNHAYRMQMIVGVKNPDSVFTWIEKVRHPIDTNRTIHYK